MIVGLDTLEGLCVLLATIHLVRMSYEIYDTYKLICCVLGGITGLYPFGLLTTLWITAKHCEESMPTILKVIYWTFTGLLCLPSLGLVCGMAVLVYDLIYIRTQDNYHKRLIKARRNFRQQLSLAIFNFVADPRRAPKPHMLYRDNRKGAMSGSILYLQQKKLPEISMLSLYFSRIFNNLTLDLQVVGHQRHAAAKEDDHIESLGSEESVDSSKGEVNFESARGGVSDEILPKPRTKYFDYLACPVCKESFVKRSEVIESPCCTQCYHQNCFFSKL